MTRASNSSAKPRDPAASPCPSGRLIRSVITKDIDEFIKTRKAMENGQTAKRYVAVCSRVAVNIMADDLIFVDNSSYEKFKRKPD